MTMRIKPLIGLPRNFTGTITLDLRAVSCGFGSCPPLRNSSGIVATKRNNGRTLTFNLTGGNFGSGSGTISGPVYTGSFYIITVGVRIDTTFVLTKRSGLQVSALAAASPNGRTLTSNDQVAPVLAAAAAQWTVRNPAASSSQLNRVDVRITDLPGRYLAVAGPGVIHVDADAAGYGWFVDATPLRNEEFTPTSRSSFRASAGSSGRDSIDLLTVLTHELGHALGLRDLPGNTNSIMAGIIDPGVRRIPWTSAVDAALSRRF